MMQPNRLFCGAVLALALLAAQTVRADDTTITLTRKFKKDSVTLYENTMKATLAGMEFHATGRSRHTVKEVKANGDVVVESQDESMKLKVGDMPEQELPASPPTTETRDKQGKLVDYKKEETPNPFTSHEVDYLMTA